MGWALRRADIAHLGMIALALALAYVLPFELLLLSYAVLGPAHYFTEISWLHDRRYFLPHRAFALALAAATLGAMFIADPYWSGVLLWSAFAACAILSAQPSPQKIALYGILAAALTLVLVALQAPFALVGILLPTFIHVCIFTLIFMTLGAMRAHSGVQFAIIATYLTGIVAILVLPPSAHTVIPRLAALGQTYFGDVAPALGSLFGIPDLQFGGRITGLLSFVYTYHYLNWFIKADVIKWSAIPRARLIAIAALSAASTGLYFYNYEIGLTVLLLISLMHVLLEFPLNATSFRQLGAAALGRPLRRSAA
ncbi:MAG TPA: hypothetical protein VMU08_18180 [Rhizomicrobium sp.]|nr:hypothetical protein [Rhizomicrobium sp.]